MAIRVRNGSKITFGSMAAAVTVSHARFQEADDEHPVVRPLENRITAAATDVLEIDTNGIVLTYKSGEFGDDHMEEVVKAYWDGTDMEIDLMTDATTVVADTGYQQQTHGGWVFDTVAD